MSRKSFKHYVARDVYLFFLSATIFKNIISSTILRWLALWQVIKKQRYLKLRQFISKFNWAAAVLSKYSNERFRKYVRMNRIIFNEILNILKNDSVFYNNLNKF